MQTFKFSTGCTDIVTASEGFVPHPYVDPGTGGEPITIGYGITVYSNGTKVTIHDAPITKEHALSELLNHLNKVVLPCINSNVIKVLNQHQLDALGSFIYNVGCGNFKSSTLLKKVNINPSDPTIATNFAQWNKGGGKVLQGLVTRRKRESDLYFTS